MQELYYQITKLPPRVRHGSAPVVPAGDRPSNPSVSYSASTQLGVHKLFGAALCQDREGALQSHPAPADARITRPRRLLRRQVPAQCRLLVLRDLRRMVNLLMDPRTMVHSLVYTAKRAPLKAQNHGRCRGGDEGGRRPDARQSSWCTALAALRACALEGAAMLTGEEAGLISSSRQPSSRSANALHTLSPARGAAS